MAGEGRRGAGILRYLREAFTFRWNLLVFGGAVAAGVISGAPDVVLPLVAAAELTYLAGLSAMPRFQAAIDARAHAEGKADVRPADAAAEAKKIGEILNGLVPEARTRFLRLRQRCVEMSRIAYQVRGHAVGAGTGEADALRVPSLDRLLWAFLRLLYAQQALTRFLATTGTAEIERQLQAMKVREQDAVARSDERIVRSVRDAIATAELRLDNHKKAGSNAEFVAVELDRIEGKIQALTEMSVSHQDPDTIASQVDAVADGMAQTEQTIRELHAITGLGEELGSAPRILESDLRQVVRE